MSEDEKSVYPPVLQQVLQQIDYLQIRVKQVSPVVVDQVRTALFLRTHFEEAAEVMEAIKQSHIKGTTQLLARGEAGFKILMENFPTVATMNQHFLDIFKENGASILQQLYRVCLVVLPIYALCSFFAVWLLTNYQYKSRLNTK